MRASDGGKGDSIELIIKHSLTASGGHHIGIAHTRWAHHGGKTDENAHPHVDSSGKIALVHNGRSSTIPTNSEPCCKPKDTSLYLANGYRSHCQIDWNIFAADQKLNVSGMPPKKH
jgi:predicted glutamine amidotransferase